MKIAIIGSGTSAIIAAKTFLEHNYKVYLFDAKDHKDNYSYTKKSKFFPSIKKSPKFENNKLIDSINEFKKKYKIKTKKFFLVSGLFSGGLSNFWGAGLEKPNKDYLNQYPFGEKILNEQNFVDIEIGIKKNRFSFYNFFYNQKIIKKLLTSRTKFVYFNKLLVAARQFGEKKITIRDYDNVDLLSGENKYIYNAKDQISKLINQKNFYYFSNCYVKNFKKIKNNYKLDTTDKTLDKIRFNKVIISAGTVGSTILVDKILNIYGKYRLFHTPVLKLIYLSLTLNFKIYSKIKFGLALLNINIKIKNNNFKGSFMQLDNIKNSFFGIKEKNFLFSFIKKFLFVGNIFLAHNYSKTFIEVKKNKTIISSDTNLIDKGLIKELKLILNQFLKKFGLYQIPYQNLKLLDNGTDAHYTSTLYNKYYKNKKILSDKCEVANFKNVFVLDGSSIIEGLHYPNYFLMIYVRYIAKKIISDDKKNKN